MSISSPTLASPIPSMLSNFDYGILSALPIGCAIFEPDGTCSYLNPFGQALLSCSQSRWKSIQFYQFLSLAELPNPYPIDQLPVARALAGETSHIDDLIVLCQGKQMILEMQAAPLWRNQDRCAIVTFQDITDRKQAAAAHEVREMQWRCLARTCLGATFQYYLKPNGTSGFRSLDDNIQEIYGFDRQLLMDDVHLVETIVYPDDRAALQTLLKQTIEAPQPIDVESRIVTPQGQIKWTKVFAQPELQANGDWIWNGAILDITERKQVELILADYQQSLEQSVVERTLELELEVQERQRAEMQAKQAELALRQANLKLERLATLDGLTQIANRRRFDEFLQWTWRMAMRERQEISVILCDVDYFKAYNDTYGHQAGDACLKMVAIALQDTVQRSGDLVARYGGEEFVIVLSNTDTIGAMGVAQRLQVVIADLAIPHAASPVSSQVTLSIGICTMVPTFMVLPESLVSCADKSLYSAKHQGRNRIVQDRHISNRLNSPSCPI